MTIAFVALLAFIVGLGLGGKWEAENWASRAASGIRKEHNGKLYIVREDQP